ncbi:LLM class F420-dependent oxidoreductase [Catenuloplanes atrovinosus]|uniref:F420-dependent oxidoreductase-like protein n=1 Tax=Catenuloplanes atrovinosus TaxID=137266 RepID=A0AAE3YPY1_9ACTN|nr:LLM class F420-dependent oxidoreductase [Catenuloplanes atrovinosus]MDR7276436.1 F420-dependent oxidoreductase-like protein [Catenuloplanes atrovinosus]
MTIRLGYQIPNFSYPGTPVDKIFGTVAAQAREAEAAGFDTVLVMDHMYQLPTIAPAEEPMLEAYTTLGALARETRAVRLATLVTGNTYRNPALLAKTVTTLDVISGGRAVLGIGAGWFQREHDDYGFTFGTWTDRFTRLDEALRIIGPMLRGEAPTLAGRWYRVENALNNPRLRPAVPIMTGGSGENRTFPLAARYADHHNINCYRPDLPHKLAVLRRRCEEIGRDPATLATSFLSRVIVTGSTAEAAAVTAKLTDFQRSVTVVGTPDHVASVLHDEVLAHGVGGLIVNMIHNGHEPGVVTAAGEALRPLLPST